MYLKKKKKTPHSHCRGTKIAPAKIKVLWKLKKTQKVQICVCVCLCVYMCVDIKYLLQMKSKRILNIQNSNSRNVLLSRSGFPGHTAGF